MENVRCGLNGTKPAPAFFNHFDVSPKRWPAVWQWISRARRNAIAIFPHEVYRRLRVDHRILGQRLVVLSDPQSIRHICGHAARKYRLSNLHLRLLRPALGAGLIVAEGKSWVLQRRLAMRLTHARTTAEQTALSYTRIDAMLNDWLDRAADPSFLLDPLQDLLALSLDLIAIHTFSYAGAVASEEILQAISAHRTTIERFDLLDVTGISPAMPSPKMGRAYSIAHSLDTSIKSMIDGAMPGHRTALDACGFEVSRDFVVSMMAGFESTTLNTLWLLGLLAEREDLIETILNERLSLEEPSTSVLGKCVLETLRLYPPLPLIYRTAADDDDTPTGPIRKGTLICMSPWIVHRHDTFWDQPAEFNWRRFDGVKKLPEGYMPFGVGERQCVGMRMGRQLVETIVRRIVERCIFRLVDERLPPPRAGVSLRPQTSMKFIVTPRSPGFSKRLPALQSTGAAACPR